MPSLSSSPLGLLPCAPAQRVARLLSRGGRRAGHCRLHGVSRSLRAAGLLTPLALLLAPPLAAQPAVAPETIVVTASRSAQPLSQVLADLSVLQRDAIERSGAVCLADLLVRLPGIEMGRNGGPGGVTSLYLRGGESRHTALYIDGMRVDGQSTGGVTWETIPIEQLERVEVLRGPAAAVYGSDAVSGVVQVFTRKGQATPRHHATLTLGSQGTRQLLGGTSGRAGALDYALQAAHGRSDGFNARNTATANPDRDGWERSTLQARAGWQFGPVHRVEGGLLASRLKAQYDGFGQVDDVADHRLQTLTGAWQARWHRDSQTRLSAGQTEATYESQPSFYRTETTLRNLTLQHEEQLGGHHLSATLERRDDHLLNPATAFAATLEGRRHQDALALGWRTELGSHGLQAHVRHDQDSEFGGQGTASTAWGWTFTPGWRVIASAATAFRAPTLYQRFSEYGVATLKPERSRNVELGLRWQGEGSEFKAALWRNQLRQLIIFGAAGPCANSFGCYENVGRSSLEGLSLSGSTTLADVRLGGSLSWHDPRNRDTDKVLVRRARQLATLTADTRAAGWLLGAEVQAAGHRWDNAANTQRMGGYGLLHLSAERALMPGLALQLRVDNVADKAWETARTYPNAGRTLQLNLRWSGA